MKYKIGVGDKKFDVEVGEIQNGLAMVTVNNKPYQVSIENYAAPMPTAPAAPAVKAAPPVSAPKAAPAPTAAPKPAPAAPAVSAPKAAPSPIAAGGNTICAPISGLLLSVKVQVGDVVSAGQVVATLEAMKMENSITSAVAGTVKEIRVQKGVEIAAGDVIMVIG